MSSTGKYPITGIKTKDPSGLLPTRKRFNDWWDKNELQVSLFIRALTKLGEKPIDERISYFQIAGQSEQPGNDQISLMYKEFIAIQRTSDGTTKGANVNPRKMIVVVIVRITKLRSQHGIGRTWRYTR